MKNHTSLMFWFWTLKSLQYCKIKLVTWRAIPSPAKNFFLDFSFSFWSSFCLEFLLAVKGIYVSVDCKYIFLPSLGCYFLLCLLVLKTVVKTKLHSAYAKLQRTDSKSRMNQIHLDLGNWPLRNPTPQAEFLQSVEMLCCIQDMLLVWSNCVGSE